jgi:hypothetical protein
MGTLAGEGSRRASEDRGVGVEIQGAVDVGEGFDEPAAEEAGATCDEEALVAHLVPVGPGFVEDEVEILVGEMVSNHDSVSILWQMRMDDANLVVDAVFKILIVPVQLKLRIRHQNFYPDVLVE